MQINTSYNINDVVVIYNEMYDMVSTGIIMEINIRKNPYYIDDDYIIDYSIRIGFEEKIDFIHAYDTPDDKNVYRILKRLGSIEDEKDDKDEE